MMAASTVRSIAFNSYVGEVRVSSEARTEVKWHGGDLAHSVFVSAGGSPRPTLEPVVTKTVHQCPILSSCRVETSALKSVARDPNRPSCPSMSFSSRVIAPSDLGPAGCHMPDPEARCCCRQQLRVDASVWLQSSIVADAPMHPSPHRHKHAARGRMDQDHADAPASKLARDESNRAFRDSRFGGEPDVAE